jgi:hypothetical protein
LRQYLHIFMKNTVARSLLGLLVVVVLADAAFYFLRTAPEAARAVSLQARVQESDGAVKGQEGELIHYLSFDGGSSGIKKFKELLPSRSDYTGIIMQVYRLAKDDRVGSSTFGAEKKTLTQVGDVIQLSFTMPIQGNYKDVRKFIYDVETFPIFLDIGHLALDGSEGSGDITLSISLSTYARS